MSELTKEQEAKFRKYIAKWENVGFCTDPADVPRAIAAAKLEYEILNVPWPGDDKVHFFRSPKELAIESAILEAYDKYKLDPKDPASRDIAKQKGLEWHHWTGCQFWVGGWWSGSPCVIDFYTTEMGLILDPEKAKKAHAFAELAQSCCYVCLNTTFFALCDRPYKLTRNAEGLLHNTTEKAIEWRDGYGLYMIHGVHFDSEEKFLKASKLISDGNIAEIMNWHDIEERQVILKCVPIEKLIEERGKLISETTEQGGYKIYEIAIDSERKARCMVYPAWSGEKTYAKFVPPDATDPLQTIAQLRGLSPEEFVNAVKS